MVNIPNYIYTPFWDSLHLCKYFLLGWPTTGAEICQGLISVKKRVTALLSESLVTFYEVSIRKDETLPSVKFHSLLTSIPCQSGAHPAVQCTHHQPPL